MNTSTIATKTHEQLSIFLGKLFPLISKPDMSFIHDMVYGIQAAGDVKLSQISRELGENIKICKTIERLSRHLRKDDLSEELNAAITSNASQYITNDSLIIIDPTDIQKPYAKSMECLAKVWDGSKQKVGDNLGYSGCMAIACNEDSRTIVPLQIRIWSSTAPDFKSENCEIKNLIGSIVNKIGNKGVYVYDRGGDRFDLFKFFLDQDLSFIIRLCKTRNLLYSNKIYKLEELVEKCKMKYIDTYEFPGSGSKVNIEFGHIPVRLCNYDQVELQLVVVNGFGSSPMLLLTNTKVGNNRKDSLRIMRRYMHRWLIEETIQYVKTAYRIEDLRVQKLKGIKTLAALVLTTAYFAAVWLGRTVKLRKLVQKITDVSQRIFTIPEFFYFALADGIKRLFSKHKRRLKFDRQQNLLFQENQPEQMFLTLPGFYP